MILLLAVLAVNIAKAQAPDPDTTAKHFLIMASIGNLNEVSSGQLAEQKGMRADVRSFGKMMVTDHGRAQQKLMQLAKMKGYNLPPEATGGIQQDPKLKNATTAFDRLYVHNMLAGHRNTVQMFENYAITGKDQDVKAFAQQTLPTLKAHLAAIEAIDKQLKDSAK